jgi:ferrous iron transport protein B
MNALVLPRPAFPAPCDEMVVLVGTANVGKSALFGALTGRYATVSNYPGTTVDVSSARATVAGVSVIVLDTPGTSSFIPLSDEERVTRDVLLDRPVRAAVVVADAKDLRRGVALALQLAEMGVPLAVCANMMDEAEEDGLSPDLELLAFRLGVDVVPTVATRGVGLRGVRVALARARPSSAHVAYPPEVERAVASLLPYMPKGNVAPRGLALMALAGTDLEWLWPRLTPRGRDHVEAACAALAREMVEPAACAIARVRLAEADRLARETAPRPAAGRRLRPAERLEALTVHPIWGYPILAAVLVLVYMFVAHLGAGVLVDLLEDGLFAGIVSPAATRLADAVVPWAWARDLLVGPYGIVTMAFAYALALILPIVSTFFVAFAVLEDSGYLPRLAVLTNRVLRGIGLNGKAVLPMVLGLGCGTMATLTTRVLETRKERMIAILLLALGVPCSAQLAVVMVLLAPLPLAATVLWAAVMAMSILTVGWLAARALPGESSELVIDLPPLRRPTLGNVLNKTLGRVEWYLKEAVPLFVIGTVVLFVADRIGALAAAARFGEPVVSGLLGLPPSAATAFVAGFLRRDFGAAGLFRLAEQGQLDPVQALVATVTVTLFIPCFASFLMIARERGWSTALAVMVFVVGFAIGVGALLRAGVEAMA